MTTRLTSISPGKQWLDTAGRPIQAHGGSIIEEDSTFYWYGENKEFTSGGNTDVWHWGVRCYSSTDLCNWDDRGLIIEPNLTDRTSPLHPSQHLDRPHIVRDSSHNRYVCWIKVMGAGQSDDQTACVLVSDSLLGPYRMEHSFVRPQGLTMGDFDLVVDGARGYLYFEHPHSEVICSDLSPGLTTAIGTVTRHFTGLTVPESREAPAYFRRGDNHYLITSGTSGYFPNRSQIAVADDPHGHWTTLGNPHPTDPSGTSFRSQVSSVFRHPHKQDLYIALADRWLPHRPPEDSDYTDLFRRYFAGKHDEELARLVRSAGRDLDNANTSIARYVWLPIRFDTDVPRIDWTDDWRIDDFD